MTSLPRRRDTKGGATTGGAFKDLLLDAASCFENSDRIRRRPTTTQSASGGQAYRWEHSAQIAVAATAPEIGMNQFDRVRCTLT